MNRLELLLTLWYAGGILLLAYAAWHTRRSRP